MLSRLSHLSGWGIVVICTPVAHDFKGILIACLLLGAFEATLAPSFLAIVQQTWRRREQTWRTVAWNVSNSIAGMVSFGFPALRYLTSKLTRSTLPDWSPPCLRCWQGS